MIKYALAARNVKMLILIIKIILFLIIWIGFSLALVWMIVGDLDKK